MKAIVYEKYGGPEVLQLKTIERPSYKANEILIRVKAAEVTKSDCEMRSFRFAVSWFYLPLRLFFGVFKPRKKVLGGYFSGEIVEVGAKVNKFRVGQKVFGACKMRFGAYAEYIALPESYTILEVPENSSFEEAASVLLGGLNALHFLRLAEMQPGEKLLINGAGGSIGTYAIQIAKTLGAEITAVDKGFKAEKLLAMGVDHFVDYEEKDFREEADKYDVVFDMVASSPLEKTLAVLNSNGRYITGNPTFKKMTSASSIYKKTGKKVIFQFAGESLEELQTLKDMIEKGDIVPPVDAVYPMDKVVEAHKRVEQEQRVGCIVLSIG